MTIYLKDKMLTKDRKFDLLLYDRFFRILSDAKHLLAINSDGGFVLILTFMKMIEATNLRTIDDIINQVEKIEPKKEPIIPEQQIEKPIVVEQKVEEVKEIVKEIKVETPKPLIIEEETRIEEVTPFDEVLIQSNNVVDLGITDSIETIDFSTPFDELPTTKPVVIETPKEEIKEEPIVEKVEAKVEKIEEIKEIEVEPILFSEYTSVNVFEEVEVIPIEGADEEDSKESELYEILTNKIYDRDFTLGECFEKNFIFNGFANNKLHIISYAQDEDRKLLYKHFGIIKTFAQDVFGHDVELDFKKEEPSVLEEKKEASIEEEKVAVEEKIEEPNVEENESGSMIEEIEMSAGCVADITKSSVTLPSQKELQINDILNSKMLDKAKELFDVKKITVKARS